MDRSEAFEQALYRLIETLKQERIRLLAGDLSNLAVIAQRKKNDLGIIEGFLLKPGAQTVFSAYRPKISAMQKLASENEALLTHTRNGVQSAQERLEKISKDEENVGAYTEHGEKLRMHESSITRRKIA
jgi:hypothetical protein